MEVSGFDYAYGRKPSRANLGTQMSEVVDKGIRDSLGCGGRLSRLASRHLRRGKWQSRWESAF